MTRDNAIGFNFTMNHGFIKCLTIITLVGAILSRPFHH